MRFGSAVNAVACAVELQQAMDTANKDTVEDRRIDRVSLDEGEEAGTLIHDQPDPDWLLRPEVGEGLALLERQGVPFDVISVLPRHLIEVIARFTRLVRTSPAVDARSGVSARFAIAATEAVVAAAVRRAAISREDQPVARICDPSGR